MMLWKLLPTAFYIKRFMTKFKVVVMLALFSSILSLAEAAGTKVLVFSKTEAIRNGSIPEGIAALKALGAQRGWTVDATEDAGRFTNTSLRPYDVVVWLNTSGDILDARQQAAYRRFHRSGKGTVAVHSGGVDTELNWRWFRQLASASAVSAPIVREATIFNAQGFNTQGRHPAAFLWPFISRRAGEWRRLNFGPTNDVFALLNANDVQTLLTAYDPVFTDPGPMVPIAWSREFDGGRYFYTMLGGRSEDYADQSFLNHLVGGVEWAARRAPAQLTYATDSEALIFREFDGVSPNGIWQKQSPSPDFRFEVDSNELAMRDSTDISMANRHLVRRGIEIDPRRPYAIKGTFRFPGPLEPRKPYSFCVNLNVAGGDDDPRGVTTWAVNIHVLTSGASVSKFMGFLDGGFFQVGQVENQWGAMDTDYQFEIHVNADLQGLPRRKMVSLRVTQDGRTLESFETDYSNFPYQPDESKPVRFGFNGHGPSWVLRNLELYYLDVPKPLQ